MQITERNYAEQLRLDGMKKIIKCGIACHVKECRVIFEMPVSYEPLAVVNPAETAENPDTEKILKNVH